MKNKLIERNIEKVINHCGQLKNNEKVLVIFDIKTLPIAKIFEKIS